MYLILTSLTPLPSIFLNVSDTNLSLTPLPSISLMYQILTSLTPPPSIYLDGSDTNLSLTPPPSISHDVSDDRETSRFVPQTKHPTDFWFAFMGNRWYNSKWPSILRGPSLIHRVTLKKHFWIYIMKNIVLFKLIFSIHLKNKVVHLLSIYLFLFINH